MSSFILIFVFVAVIMYYIEIDLEPTPLGAPFWKTVPFFLQKGHYFGAPGAPKESSKNQRDLAFVLETLSFYGRSNGAPSHLFFGVKVSKQLQWTPNVSSKFDQH